MLSAGWEVRFQVRGHSVLIYGPTLSRQMTFLFFSVVNWLTSWFVPSTHVHHRKKSKERTNEELVCSTEIFLNNATIRECNSTTIYFLFSKIVRREKHRITRHNTRNFN